MPPVVQRDTETLKAQKRVSRACIRCRQKKSKCNLWVAFLEIGEFLALLLVRKNMELSGTDSSAGEPPCERCVLDGSNCVLASSHRGGHRIKKSTRHPDVTTPASLHRSPIFVAPETCAQDYSRSDQSSVTFIQEKSAAERSKTPAPSIAAVIENTFVSTNLHDTTDALNFLSQAAQMSEEAAARSIPKVLFQTPVVRNEPYQSYMNGAQGRHNSRNSNKGDNSIMSYYLIAMGFLSVDQVIDLVSRFARLYHPFLPIAPKRSMEIAFLADTAKYEPHLLTAMLTVASKGLPEDSRIPSVCARYMEQLVSEISAGKRCDVEAVEALLILAEWEPQSAISNTREVGCGEEDLAAWMHVGIALRIGYFLGLDKTCFKNDDEEKMQHYHRRRLAWAACYISDRQISVRIGRAFWCRGPGPVSTIGKHPSLQPQEAGGDDYASIFQATLELTQLFGNVHDVLYSGIGSSMKMMLLGNYVKYIDDFRAAISSWRSVWGTLTCSSNLKMALQMTYEYLRLYNSAYALQATAFRSMSSKQEDVVGAGGTSLGQLGALPDARFVYESIDAAKCLLTLVNNFSQRETSLRHFPMRFSLYCVNSAVFLYKAWSLGILGVQEKIGVRRMIKDSISRLRAGSVRLDDFGSRYARLLELLWCQADEDVQGGGIETATDPYPTPVSQLPVANQPEEFSWLDLQAVGEFLTGEQETVDFDSGNDYIQEFVQASRRGSINWNDLGWSDNDMTRFF